MNETIELDADETAAVQFLEEFLKAADHPISPIHPTSAPRPSNSPILDGETSVDKLNRQLDEMTDAERRRMPTTATETREQTVRRLMSSDANYQKVYGQLARLLTSDGTAVTKADSDRQAKAEAAIYKAGDQFARQRGITPERARTIIRRAYRELAYAELGRDV
jgi:hypothetical protein